MTAVRRFLAQLEKQTAVRALIFAGLLALIAALGGMCAVMCAMGQTSIYYYPKIILTPLSGLQTACLAAYLVFMLVPVVLDVRGMRQWN